MSSVHDDQLGARQAERIADLGDERGKLEARPPRRDFLRLAEIERARAQPDGAVERGDQLRHRGAAPWDPSPRSGGRRGAARSTACCADRG